MNCLNGVYNGLVECMRDFSEGPTPYCDEKLFRNDEQNHDILVIWLDSFEHGGPGDTCSMELARGNEGADDPIYWI